MIHYESDEDSKKIQLHCLKNKSELTNHKKHIEVKNVIMTKIIMRQNDKV